MNLIVCVDDRMGMLFNQRRQSQDRLLRARILQLTAGGLLWMNAYSAKQFAGMDAPQLQVDAHFLARAGTGDFCFVEDQSLLPWEDKVEKLILYRWNRCYPAQLYFDIPLVGWRLECQSDFPGSSHEKITEEIYMK